MRHHPKNAVTAADPAPHDREQAPDGQTRRGPLFTPADPRRRLSDTFQVTLAPASEQFTWQLIGPTLSPVLARSSNLQELQLIALHLNRARSVLQRTLTSSS